MDAALEEPAQLRPTRQQVDCAWNYAYRFFFDYPLHFPWHLLLLERAGRMACGAGALRRRVG